MTGCTWVTTREAPYETVRTCPEKHILSYTHKVAMGESAALRPTTSLIEKVIEGLTRTFVLLEIVAAR